MASRLIVISAPSGAGKTTLCQRLLKEVPGLRPSISSTTRAPRGTEKNGTEYLFLSKPEFEARIRAGRFAEYAQVHGNYYGTSRDVIDDAFRAGLSVLLDIDVQGAASLRRAYPRECFTLFIAPPSLEVLERRLRERGTEGEQSIRERMTAAAAEMARISEFDARVVNDRLEEAFAELKRIVSQEVR